MDFMFQSIQFHLCCLSANGLPLPSPNPSGVSYIRHNMSLSTLNRNQPILSLGTCADSHIGIDSQPMTHLSIRKLHMVDNSSPSRASWCLDETESPDAASITSRLTSFHERRPYPRHVLKSYGLLVRQTTMPLKLGVPATIFRSTPLCVSLPRYRKCTHTHLVLHPGSSLQHQERYR